MTRTSDPAASTSYILPSKAPPLRRRPAKPPARVTESPEPEIIESVPTSAPASVALPITTQSSAKRSAPDDGDVSVGADDPKRRKVGEEDPVADDDDEEDDIHLVES